jgi:anion-transporting  ArsA/GET3 family ATPase
MRLAEALGLTGVVPGDQHELSVEQLRRAGVPAQAPVTVAMLDTARAWTDVIAREVPSLALRRQILDHPFFLRLTADLAGSREYAAMEEVYHLYLRGGFDLLVLDTPPTVHGFDFLEAPDRVLDVLEHEGYRWLLRPALLAGKVGLKALDFSGSYVVRTLSRFTGMAFLRELAVFVDLFSSLLEGFRQRAAAVKATLRSPVTAFVLVTSPDAGLVAETMYLHHRLCRQELPPELVLVNRVTEPPPPLPDQPRWRERLAEEVRSGAPLLSALERAHLNLSRLAARDHRQLEALRRDLEDRSLLVTVARQPQDIHDLSGLEQMRRALFGAA